jgi:hypothetical protein
MGWAPRVPDGLATHAENGTAATTRIVAEEGHRAVLVAVPGRPGSAAGHGATGDDVLDSANDGSHEDGNDADPAGTTHDGRADGAGTPAWPAGASDHGGRSRSGGRLGSGAGRVRTPGRPGRRRRPRLVGARVVQPALRAVDIPLEVLPEPFGHGDVALLLGDVTLPLGHVALPLRYGPLLLVDVAVQPRQGPLHGVNPALFGPVALGLLVVLARRRFRHVLCLPLPLAPLPKDTRGPGDVSRQPAAGEVATVPSRHLG